MGLGGRMHPERLGPWQIERRIGAGGMGNVYLGVHAETGERAAVQVLPASRAREAGFEPRFSREISALRRVSH
ncbi:MAG: serine/threonine protein kinase, partial [Planctomyces sp.]